MATTTLFAACGSDGGEQSATTDPSTVMPTAVESTAAPDTQAPTSTGPAVAERSGTLTAALDADPVSLDPHTNSNFSSLQVLDHIYESLTTFDANGDVAPALAASWEINADATEYTFTLREGVMFHDGSTFDAEDVVYSLNRVLNPDTAAPFVGWLGPVKEVVADDDLTVRVSYNSPFSGLLSSLAARRASAIMPSGFAEANDPTKVTIGTGPFVLREYVPDDRVILDANESYWDPALPKISELQLKVLVEESARVAALQAGQVDFASVSAQSASSLESGGLNVLRSPTAWLGLTIFNLNVAPLDDPKVREALRLAISVPEVIEKAGFGAGVQSGPIATGFGNWYLEAADLPTDGGDKEAAQRLLEEAGYGASNPISLKITTSPEYSEFTAIAQILQESWRQIGVESEIDSLEFSTYVDTYKAGEFEVFVGAHSFRPNPQAALFPYFHPDGTQNYGYENPEVTRLIDTAAGEPDEARREELYKEAQKLLLMDSPYLWFYARLGHEAVSDRVKGYTSAFNGLQTAFRFVSVD